MKRFIYRKDPKYHDRAALRIMGEVLNHIPDDKHIMVFIQQDLKVLQNANPGVYYVTNKSPRNVKIIRADVHHYFYRYVVMNKKKRIQTFLIIRIPIH